MIWVDLRMVEWVLGGVDGKRLPVYRTNRHPMT